MTHFVKAHRYRCCSQCRDELLLPFNDDTAIDSPDGLTDDPAVV
jgi:hypothetical protein